MTEPITSDKGLKKVTYEDYKWKDLPPDAVLAAMTLGYTQDMWELEEDPHTSGKQWADLTFEQRTASLLLYGFGQEQWDNQDDDDYLPNYFDTYDWQSLPNELKKAAGVLGYSERTWNLDEKPTLSTRAWE